jgi:hypothetical protein
VLFARPKIVVAYDRDAITHLVELLEYEPNDLLALERLESFANHADVAVRSSVQRVARALSPEFKGSVSEQKRLEKLAASS